MNELILSCSYFCIQWCFFIKKRDKLERNLNDVILSLKEFYLTSFFSIKKRDTQSNKQTDKHTETQIRPLLRNKCLWTHYYHRVGIILFYTEVSYNMHKIIFTCRAGSINNSLLYGLLAALLGNSNLT